MNIEKYEFSILEKYIYYINVFHMNKINIQLNYIYISFTFYNNINFVNKTKPFMCCVSFLEDNERHEKICFKEYNKKSKEKYTNNYL